MSGEQRNPRVLDSEIDQFTDLAIEFGAHAVWDLFDGLENHWDEEQRARIITRRVDALYAYTREDTDASAGRSPGIHVVDLDRSSEFVEGDFLEREANYIVDIFGIEGLDLVTINDRQAVTVAVNEMYFHDNSFKKRNYDSSMERLSRFFSDMSYSDIAKKQAELSGEETSMDNERGFYWKTKNRVKSRFSPEGAIMVLRSVLNQQEIDWQMIKETAPPPEQKPKTKPTKEATKRQPKVVEQKVEGRDYDPFMKALAAPDDWDEDEAFKDEFDQVVAAVIDQAADETRLSKRNAYAIKTRLGLPAIPPEESEEYEYSNNPLGEIEAELKHHQGRLVHSDTDGRVKVMKTALGMFVHDKLPVAGIVERFGGKPLAGLLLKAAVAEIFQTSIHAAHIRRER